jgi:hypothetical protein
MSFDLFAWETPVVADEEEAAPLIKRYVDTGDDSGFGASSDVAAFCDELSQKYPPPEPGASVTPRRRRRLHSLENSQLARDRDRVVPCRDGALHVRRAVERQTRRRRMTAVRFGWPSIRA